jgi:hypothetical protein
MTVRTTSCVKRRLFHASLRKSFPGHTTQTYQKQKQQRGLSQFLSGPSPIIHVLQTAWFVTTELQCFLDSNTLLAPFLLLLVRV